MDDARKCLLTPTSTRSAKRRVLLGVEVLDERILPSASVSGQAFLDANSDGLLNNNESGASGIQVNLENSSNQILLSSNTDTNGNYQFSVSSALLSQYGGSGSGAGFQIQIAMPNGFAASPENVSGGINSNINAQGYSNDFSLSDGGNQVVNAGLVAPSASVSGEIFLDSNADGLLDNGESGAAGVAVNLLNASGQVLLSTNTDSSGDYQFSVSPLLLLQQGGGSSGSAGEYQVQIVLPSGDVASPENVGGGGTNSNINPDGYSNLFSLQPGGNQVVNAGLAAAPIVEGELWLDSNDDGLLENSEAAASGIVVNLTNSSGQVLLSTTTNANGNYQLQVNQLVLDQGNGGQASGLAIQVVVPNGDWTSPENVYGSGINSNVDSSGDSELFGLQPGGVQQINAGLVAPAYVSGEIYLDSNADGLLDNGESPASGVQVHLDNIYGAVLLTTTTDANGNYQFQVGQAVLSQITQSSSSGAQIQVVIPSNEVATVENAAGSGINSNINSSGYSNIFALLGGGDQQVNAGLAPQPVVDGEVWLDDGDGILDNGESGLSGVQVDLENAAGDVLMSTDTDANGNYQFNVPQSVLNQGNGSGSGSGSGSGWGSGFEIQVVFPAGDVATVENASGSGINSNINASGYSNIFTLPPGGNPQVNAGLVAADIWEPVAGGDYLWSDPANWSLKVAPDNGVAAIFDGYYNSQVIVDVATSEATIILQNGFTAPFEIQGGGAALDIPAYDDSNNAGGTFNVNFLAANAPVNYDGAGRTYNITSNIDYGTGGKVNILNAAIVNFGVGANLTQESGSPINVTNGTLNFGDGKDSGAANYSAFMLTTASADINIQTNGIMNIYQTGGTPIENTLGGQGSVISNNGVVNLKHVVGGAATTIAEPLQNHGTLNVPGGDWTFSQKDASGNDLSMDGGSINLSVFAKVFCFHGYTQTGGTFNINTSKATFAVTGVPANFNGGTVSFATDNGVLNTGGIAFNGATLNMSITGNSTASNVINSTSCSIQGNSTITVKIVGDAESQEPWALIQNPAGNNITGDFATINLPLGIIETQVTNTWSCGVT